MAGVNKDNVRERRIDMEVVVDAYDEQERTMGWYTYVKDELAFPFQARCIVERRSTTVQRGEVVDVTGMAPGEDCAHDMLVDVQWQGAVFSGAVVASGRRGRRRSHQRGDW